MMVFSAHRSPLTAHRLWDWRLLPLLLLPFLALGSAPLFDLDEGAFTASTTEMFLRGDFLSTHLLGVPRYDKPILSYWLEAASAHLFGFNEWGFRLPSALAASLWIGLTWAFARRVLGREAGLMAALIVATAVGLTIIERAATADALLNLWLAASGYLAWLWLEEERPRWRLLGFAAMALGFLTKGPVAVVVPGGAVFLWCLSQGQWRRFFRWALDWKAIALFLAIAAPWFVAETIHEGPGFIAGFFLKQNLSRFEAPMEGHSGNYFYYVPVVLLSLLPHTGLLFSAAGRLKALWQDELMRYGLLWFALVFVLFSFSGTKLPHYVYYGYGGLVLPLARRAAATEGRWLALVPGVFLFALLLALPLLLAHFTPRLKPDDQLLAAGLPEAFGTAYWVGCGAALAASLALLFVRRVGLTTALYADGLMAAVALAILLIPAAGWLLQSPVKQAGVVARSLPGPLVMYGPNTPSFQTYARRQVVKRDPRPGDLVFTRQSRLSRLPGARVLYRNRGYDLVRMP
jgi:4-amino-4-deoxy-L-arabinose transferase-like glycosyltransferase